MVPFVDGRWCVSRGGQDEIGRYTEYCIEENTAENWGNHPAVGMSCSKWSHADCCNQPAWSTNDGVWRIYDGDESGARKVKLMSYSCSAANKLWYRGKLLWDNLSSHVGQEIVLSTAFTSYGINSNLTGKSSAAAETLVLVDYVDPIADPTATDFTTKLFSPDSARHRGRMNIGRPDGSVICVGASQLYNWPDAKIWNP